MAQQEEFAERLVRIEVKSEARDKEIESIYRRLDALDKEQASQRGVINRWKGAIFLLPVVGAAAAWIVTQTRQLFGGH